MSVCLLAGRLWGKNIRLPELEGDISGTALGPRRFNQIPAGRPESSRHRYLRFEESFLTTAVTFPPRRK